MSMLRATQWWVSGLPLRVCRDEFDFTEVPSDNSSNENAEENYTCRDTRNLYAF